VRRLEVGAECGPALEDTFDTRALGYGPSLVAAKTAPERVDEAAEVINRHPGVSHNPNAIKTRSAEMGKKFCHAPNHSPTYNPNPTMSNATVVRLPTVMMQKL